MKKVILSVFALLFIWLFYNKTQKLSIKTKIDFLGEALSKVEDKNLIKRNAYFSTNMKYESNYQLYFQTQFNIAPKVLVRTKLQNIPKDSLILHIEEKRNKRKTPSFIKNIKDTIYFNDDNEFYRYLILKNK